MCGRHQVGTLYAIYTLHETQPGARKARAYIPINTLRILIELVKEARRRHIPDTAAVVDFLLRKHALAFGAVLRPSAGTPVVTDRQPRYSHDLHAGFGMQGC